MAVRSRRLFGPTSLAFPGSYTVYTVPSGRTLILKTLIIANPSTSAARGGRWLINGTGVTNQKVTGILTAAAGSVNMIEPWWVLNPGDTLACSVDVGSINVWGFGALLLGAPA